MLCGCSAKSRVRFVLAALRRSYPSSDYVCQMKLGPGYREGRVKEPLRVVNGNRAKQRHSAAQIRIKIHPPPGCALCPFIQTITISRPLRYSMRNTNGATVSAPMPPGNHIAVIITEPHRVLCAVGIEGVVQSNAHPDAARQSTTLKLTCGPQCSVRSARFSR